MTKIQFIIIFFGAVKLITADEDKVKISFDKIFPETKIEKLYKIVFQIYGLIHSPHSKNYDFFLDLLFDYLIVLHFFVISLKHNNKILNDDLFNLLNLINKILKIITEKIFKNINEREKNIIYLLNFAKKKIESFTIRNQYQHQHQSF